LRDGTSAYTSSTVSGPMFAIMHICCKHTKVELDEGGAT
jgi:hypothetical protein